MADDWFALYERVATAGFPVVMFFLLVGSFLEIWVWGKSHRRDIAEIQAVYEKREAVYETRVKEWQARSEKLEARADALQDTLLRISGILEHTATSFIGKQRGS